MTVPFTEDDLRRVAAPRSFERGLGYVGSVVGIDVRRDHATATVYGGDAYLVRLSWTYGEPEGACTCPHGEEGFFCKHCVALGLSLLDMRDDFTELVSAGETKGDMLADWLRSLSHEELVAELLDIADRDPEQRRRYELRAASSTSDAEAVRRSIRELIQIDGYIPYDRATDYSDRVNDAATAIRGLIDGGKAEEAIDLAREALELFADSYESVDDSSGWVGESVSDLHGVHLEACEASPPDPEDLARYLADLLLHDNYGFAPDIGDYAHLLGAEGMARVREEIAKAFARDPGNWAARNLMEARAKAEGDVDLLVAVYAASLDSSGLSHMQIVRELDAADRGAEALAWAERGLLECSSPRQDLVEYVADRYATAGRGDDLLELRRARFAAERSLPSYRALRSAARAFGDWPAERESALAGLRADMSSQRTLWGPVLVDALTDDGDIDAAWAEAARGVATQAQALRLADASIAVRPADALAVYLNAIAPLYQETGDGSYRRMARLLVSARACHEALGTLDEFETYLTALRTDLKRRRNLIRILDENGL